jgi:hypothetical protein
MHFMKSTNYEAFHYADCSNRRLVPLSKCSSQQFVLKHIQSLHSRHNGRRSCTQIQINRQEYKYVHSNRGGREFEFCKSVFIHVLLELVNLWLKQKKKKKLNRSKIGGMKVCSRLDQ